MYEGEWQFSAVYIANTSIIVPVFLYKFVCVNLVFSVWELSIKMRCFPCALFDHLHTWSRQSFNLYWVMLYSSETKKAAQTMLTSSTLHRKWRWHNRKSGRFWIRPGQKPGGTTWWATIASGKKTSDCLNQTRRLFFWRYFVFCFLLSRQQRAY